MFCIPIVAVSTDDAIRKLCYGDPYADLFEIRLDLMEEYDLKRLLSVTKNKVLVTYRSESEGGKGSNGQVLGDSSLLHVQRQPETHDSLVFTDAVSQHLLSAWRQAKGSANA